MPALVISGEEDPVLPPVRAESALKHMSRATHIVVPAVAHGPDFPGCVERLAAEFLEAGSAEKLDTACAARLERPAFTLPK